MLPEEFSELNPKKHHLTLTSGITHFTQKL